VCYRSWTFTDRGFSGKAMIIRRLFIDQKTKVVLEWWIWKFIIGANLVSGF
jgi:hypothetical protein